MLVVEAIREAADVALVVPSCDIHDDREESRYLDRHPTGVVDDRYDCPAAFDDGESPDHVATNTGTVGLCASLPAAAVGRGRLRDTYI